MTERTAEEIAGLVEAAETALLHEAYMDLRRWNETWEELEKALEPFRPDCACGMKNAPPMHLHSAPYFCDVEPTR